MIEPQTASNTSNQHYNALNRVGRGSTESTESNGSTESTSCSTVSSNSNADTVINEPFPTKEKLSVQSLVNNYSSNSLDSGTTSNSDDNSEDSKSDSNVQSSSTSAIAQDNSSNSNQSSPSIDQHHEESSTISGKLHQFRPDPVEEARSNAIVSHYEPSAHVHHASPLVNQKLPPILPPLKDAHTESPKESIHIPPLFSSMSNNIKSHQFTPLEPRSVPPLNGYTFSRIPVYSIMQVPPPPMPMHMPMPTPQIHTPTPSLNGIGSPNATTQDMQQQQAYQRPVSMPHIPAHVTTPNGNQTATPNQNDNQSPQLHNQGPQTPQLAPLQQYPTAHSQPVSPPQPQQGTVFPQYSLQDPQTLANMYQAIASNKPYDPLAFQNEYQVPSQQANGNQVSQGPQVPQVPNQVPNQVPIMNGMYQFANGNSNQQVQPQYSIETGQPLYRQDYMNPNMKIFQFQSNQRSNTTQQSGQQHPEHSRRRGNLPKEVTRLLKNWLVDNIDNPYPTEEDKMRLVEQTGLSLVQISNWFINARRRSIPASMRKRKISHSDRKHS